MFVATSAFVAILTNEPDAPRLSAAIGSARRCYASGLVRLETVMRTASKLLAPIDAVEAAFDEIIEGGRINIVSISDGISRQAVAALAAYGKGRGHPAKLNLADCMSYAVAKAYRLPILFIGEDFIHTDLTSVLDDPRPTKPAL